jgi:hypothetical protein
VHSHAVDARPGLYHVRHTPNKLEARYDHIIMTEASLVTSQGVSVGYQAASEEQQHARTCPCCSLPSNWVQIGAGKGSMCAFGTS